MTQPDRLREAAAEVLRSRDKTALRDAIKHLDEAYRAALAAPASDIERQRVEQAFIDGSVEGSPVDHDGNRAPAPDLIAAVEALRSPARYSVDQHGTMWTTDMEHGWETAYYAVLALIESRSLSTSREAGLDAERLYVALDTLKGNGDLSTNDLDELAENIAAEYASLASAMDD